MLQENGLRKKILSQELLQSEKKYVALDRLKKSEIQETSVCLSLTSD